MKVKISKKAIIKPSSPTPNHLRIFKLSLLDQLSPTIHGSMALFYSATKLFTAFQQSQILQKSLSKILTGFYPFAGRIRDDSDSLIECNDEGAVYLEARVDSSIAELLDKPNNQMIRKLIPVENLESSSESVKNIVLLVQATFFACGGLAIGVWISPKIADGSTTSSFIIGWAAKARKVEDDEAVHPQLNVSSIFPPQNLPSDLVAFKTNEEKGVAQRFVFHGKKIAALKDKAGGQNPTRVEAVTALIWKTAIKASRSLLSNSNDEPKTYYLSQAVNIRKWMPSLLTEHSVGNIRVRSWTQITVDSKTDLDLGSIVSLVRKGIRDFRESYVKKLEKGDGVAATMELLKEVDQGSGKIHEFYTAASLCRFPLYRTDFGWGKPIWVVPPRPTTKNTIALVDTKDGDGIEAWVTLKEADMAVFQNDQQLLAFASLNPGVLINTTILPKSCL